MKNSINTEIHTVSILDILTFYGHHPVRQRGAEFTFFSPFNNEKTPSFSANIKKNVFYDFSSGLKGNKFQLVMELEKVAYSGALQLIANMVGNIPPLSDKNFRPKSLAKKESIIKIDDVRSIESVKLIQYLSERRIDLEIAQLWLKEIHFRLNGKSYYALGFLNDSGGFELRNSKFKGKTRNGVTTIQRGTSTISLFEGFFDFLSAMMYYETDRPSYTTYILNSTVNIESVLHLIKRDTVVHSFLDNDEAGKRVLKTLELKGIRVKNFSEELFPKFNDFNEFWVG
ncbi:MAG: CHC2 zinc finger domain-containing protein [Cytophagales bacterium]|nr:CHC2 zinc finger domain-containing protein [Cytophagales bacterium]